MNLRIGYHQRRHLGRGRRYSAPKISENMYKVPNALKTSCDIQILTSDLQSAWSITCG